MPHDANHFAEELKMESHATAPKKQCLEPKYGPSKLSAELIELIVMFLPSREDLFRLVRAIPKEYLTQAVQALERLFFLQNSQDNNANDVCSPLSINACLWPSLPLTQDSVKDEGVAIVEKCASLYTSATVKPVEGLFKLLPNSVKRVFIGTAKMDSALSGALMATQRSQCMIYMNSFSKMEDQSQLLPLWTKVARFSNLSKLTLLVDSYSAQLLILVVRILKSSTTLKELFIDARSWVFDDHDPELWTTPFIKDLAHLSKQLDCLRFEDMTFPIKVFTRYFKDCTTWLLKQEPKILQFKHGKLSGLAIDTIDTLKLFKFIRGKDLEDLTLSCRMPEPDILTDDLIRVLHELYPMKNLRQLTISGYWLNARCSGQLAVLIQRLQELTLTGNDLNDNCVCILSHILPKCTRLEELTIAGQKVSDSGAIAIANAISQGCSIRKLDLSCNNIGNAGVAALAPVIVRLDSIDLSKNQIGYDGAIAISQVVPHTDHASIALNLNPLTKEGVDTIVSELKLRTCRRGTIEMKNVIEPTAPDLNKIPTNLQAFKPLPSKKWCDLRFDPSLAEGSDSGPEQSFITFLRPQQH